MESGIYFAIITFSCLFFFVLHRLFTAFSKAAPPPKKKKKLDTKERFNSICIELVSKLICTEYKSI